VNAIRQVALLTVLLCNSPLIAAVLPEVPEGAQAISLLGAPLYAPAPGQGALERLALAAQDFEADPDGVNHIIWYGRRTAYSGDYRGAIAIYSAGIEKFPDDARLYRHRGHRYITIREFDRAIADLEHAAKLIEGTDNEIEPDGMPNAFNIPVSSLHGNVWYHLGLAYYLKHDWDNAYRAYTAGFDAGRNDDNRVSTTHWLYMILRRKGDVQGAERVIDAISADMNVIENTSYYKLCLFYKGELSLDDLLSGGDDSSAGAAIVYGAANWLYYNGQVEQAEALMRDLLATDGWASFGYIAAEADLAARQGPR
jgi:tetratricopeptide (TPR) repeat protein